MAEQTPVTKISWTVDKYGPPRRINLDWAGRRVVYVEWHEAAALFAGREVQG